MTAAETRLGAEYDPAEHHDLDRIDTHPLVPTPGDPLRHVAICACGWASPSKATRTAAHQAWDEHRQRKWFG